jgi:predicted dehydrogenase
MSNNGAVFAIVGYGGMGTHHGSQLAKVEGARLKGVFDIKEERRGAAAAGLRAYASLAEVLADPEIDVVLVATPNDSHREITVAALDAGKHVICEKPATLGAAEFAKMTAAAKRAGKVLAVHQNRRWDSDFLTVKKIVDSGLIGEVHHVESRIHGSRGIPGDWRRKAANGGGMMLDWGVHLLDRLLILFPEQIERVYCRLSYAAGHEVDDGFILQLDFRGGRSVLADVGTCNYISLPKWYVVGRKGSAVIEDWEMNGRVVQLTDLSSADVNPIVAGAGYTKTMAARKDESVAVLPLPVVTADEKDFYRNFIAATRGEAEQIVKNEEVMRVMKLVDAAFASHREGRAVSFE